MDVQRLKSYFKASDTDGSGKIPREELEAVLGKLEPSVSWTTILDDFGPEVDYNKFVDFLFSPGEELEQSNEATHVAIIGAGFVGTCTAYSLLCKGIGAKITVTDVNQKKCEGEALDLEDGYAGGKVKVATLPEAGQADMIIITAGRGQKEGETRLDLIKANSGILESVIKGMQPIKRTAKIMVVSNPCDPLTYVAQECSGLPIGQVFGSGTVLDSMRLQVALANVCDVNPSSVKLYVFGEHGDSQFPAVSLARVGGVPLMEMPQMEGIDVFAEAKKSSRKAYDIIAKKGYTAFGVAQAVATIVDVVLNDRHSTLPVSVRVPGKNCCLSLPSVVGINGVHRILEHVTDHFDEKERLLYANTIRKMQEAVGTAPDEPAPVVPELEVVESRLPSKPPRKSGGSHVAVIGAGFVGTSAAFAMVCKHTAAKITLTDVNQKKCEGEVMDLEDGGVRVEMATPQEAGQADVIVITAGRPQKPGETRLDLVKANAAIMTSIIKGMQPLKPTAKILVVANPCDALTYVAQEISGLPKEQVFGSGCLLDSRRLRVALSKEIGVEPSSITLYVFGEHGDSQFPVASLANIGGVPLLECHTMQSVDLYEESKKSARKAYTIIDKKGYTAFGIGRAVDSIVRAILKDRKQVMPVSVRLPGKDCVLSLPAVVGIHGVERILDHVLDHFTDTEKQMYAASVKDMEEAAAATKPQAFDAAMGA